MIQWYYRDADCWNLIAGGLLVSEGTFIAEEAGGISHVPGNVSRRIRSMPWLNG